jgi:hypothetical protein
MFRPTSNVGKAAKRSALSIIAGTAIATSYHVVMGQNPVATLSLGVGALIGIATLIAYYKPAK